MRIACLSLMMLISCSLARAEDFSGLTPTAAAQEVSPTAAALQVSPTAEAASLSPTASASAALFPPEQAGGSEEVSLPAEEAPAEKPAPRMIMRPRFPLSEMCLAGLGGTIIGGWLGFFSSDQTSSGAIDYSSVRRNVMIYGGIGAAAGATLGYLLGSKNEVVPAPQGSLPKPAMPPLSVAMNINF